MSHHFPTAEADLQVQTTEQSKPFRNQYDIFAGSRELCDRIKECSRAFIPLGKVTVLWKTGLGLGCEELYCCISLSETCWRLLTLLD